MGGLLEGVGDCYDEVYCRFVDHEVYLGRHHAGHFLGLVGDLNCSDHCCFGGGVVGYCGVDEVCDLDEQVYCLLVVEFLLGCLHDQLSLLVLAL